uniref:ATPase subunit 8 n=1 Tax=Boa constrictor TaxID=8574 RepID=Q402Q3_BOACO|nr:ATP synthase F0 subunit 8 [Boa constrictor]BAE19992.1 ATPase subunit 8 [Boa constrictor]
MPQLDIVFIMMVYTWTWMSLMIMTWKIQKMTMNNVPEKNNMLMNNTEHMPTLPWT